MIKGIEHEWLESQAQQHGLFHWLIFALIAIPLILFFSLVFGYFAISALSYWWTFGTLCAFAYFINQQFKRTQTVSVRRALITGLIIALAFTVITHQFAYQAFKDNIEEYLLTETPGYMDINWSDPPDTDTLHESWVETVSEGELHAGIWTSLRIRAAGGVQINLRATKRMGIGRGVIATWKRAGITVWFLYILQLLGILTASVGATLAGASMREVQLEDIYHIAEASDHNTNEDKRSSNQNQHSQNQRSIAKEKIESSSRTSSTPSNDPTTSLTKPPTINELVKALKSERWKKVMHLASEGEQLGKELLSEPWLTSLLSKCVQNSNTVALTAFLTAGTPKEIVIGPDGQTLLMFAAEYSRFECVEILLKAGADVFATDDEGHGVLYHAESWHYERSPNLIVKTKALLQAALDDPWRLQKQSSKKKSVS